MLQVALVSAISTVRRLYYMIEQPQSSVMFHLPHFAALITTLGLTLVPTWLGFWGHPLVKPSKLLVNFVNTDTNLGNMCLLFVFLLCFFGACALVLQEIYNM